MHILPVLLGERYPKAGGWLVKISRSPEMEARRITFMITFRATLAPRKPQLADKLCRRLAWYQRFRFNHWNNSGIVHVDGFADPFKTDLKSKPPGTFVEDLYKLGKFGLNRIMFQQHDVEVDIESVVVRNDRYYLSFGVDHKTATFYLHFQKPFNTQEFKEVMDELKYVLVAFSVVCTVAHYAHQATSLLDQGQPKGVRRKLESIRKVCSSAFAQKATAR